MAIFYRKTSKVESEKSIKALLREYLSDDWHIFQSIPLDTKRADGEIDFFLLHKSVGAIVLEVKGGIIEAELNKDNVGQWYSTNTQKVKNKIKDPYQQALDQSYKISNYIKNTQTLMYTMNIVSAVAFPDIKELNVETPYINNLNTLTAGKFNKNLEKNLLKLLRNKNRTPHSESFFNQLIKYLEVEFSSDESLFSKIKSTELELNKITEEQFQVMEGLESNKKLYIHGPAGSGKTVIAINFVKRMVANDATVVFLCHTTNLGTYLAELFTDNINNNLYVGNIFSVERKIESMIDAHAVFGLSDEQEEKYKKLVSEKEKWLVENTVKGNKKKIEFFIENIYRYFDILNITVDHIVIDECQDFETEWLESLELANTYNPEGKFYMFGDPGQSSISDWTPSFDTPSYKLTKNLRNSDEVNKFINKYFKTESKSSEIKSGFEVDLIVLNSNDRTQQDKEITNKLPELLSELTSKEIEFNQIAILCLKQNHTEQISNILYKDKKLYEHEELTIDSCLRYKGLEKDVVMVLLPDWYIYEKNRFLSQVYTGITRPKSVLKVLIGQSNLELLNKTSSL